MTRSKAKAFARRARKEEEIGENPVCYRCGFDGFDALLKVQVEALEEHHVEGQNHNGDFTVIACRNCHAILHGKYSDAGVLLEVQPSFFDRLVQTQKARAELLIDLGEYMKSELLDLSRRIERLDRCYPNWREVVSDDEDDS